MFGKAKQIQQTDTHCTELQDILRAIKHTMAVIEFSTEGIIIDANENFLRTMGYTLDEIKDKHHSMFCLPDVVRSMEYDNFWIDLRAGKSKSGLFRRIAKGGKDIYLEANYIPILDVNGRVYKIIKFANDITTRHYELMDLKNTICCKSLYGYY
ncbi:PAS domain-containing protein [Campylobacter sp. TJR-1]|uniref:PAS domain-containing protein n=1 Tax=Campylobacter sp. TJR-1 TaxID=3079310 RepID=UPI003977A324